MAAELVEVQKRLAEQTNDAAVDEARLILSDGHHEAAAILLEARMRVADNLRVV